MVNSLKAILLFAIISLISIQAVLSVPAEPFCGTSTFGQCNSNSDCEAGGCSGEVCEAKGEGTITPCIYRECYEASNYNLSCQCISNKCQWGYQDQTPFSTTTVPSVTTTTAPSSVSGIVMGVYSFLASFNPILLLILGVILILAAKLAKFVGIVLIILALIGLLLFFFH